MEGRDGMGGKEGRGWVERKVKGENGIGVRRMR